MNDLIRQRDKRTKKRKEVKRKMDSIIGLSYHDEEHNALSLTFDATKLASKTVRLLDEGFIDNGFVIKKGALEKYLNGENEYVRGWEYDDKNYTRTEVLNLTDSFIGTVNLGHMDFATFPIILGEWTKNDLSIVDIENDRKGLNIDLHLDEESVFVKELKRQKHDIGVSAEFWYHINNEDTTALSEMLGYYMPVFDEIFIFAYGLVGECGNVNSSGLELKGDTPMSKDIENLSTAEVEELEESELDADSEEVESEEVESEEADPENGDGDEADDDEADEVELALAAVQTLREMVATLTTQVAELTEANEQLKKTNRRLQSKLQSEKEKKERFIKSTKDVSVQLLPNEEVKPNENKVTNNYMFGDGIGEF